MREWVVNNGFFRVYSVINADNKWGGTSVGIKLDFLKAQDFEYTQFGSDFQPVLSIIDILMFNGKDQTRALIDNCYDLY